MKSLLLLLIGVAAAFSLQRGCQQQAVEQSPGVLVREVPQQEDLSRAEARPFDYKGHRVEPQARYALRARLLSRRDYNLGREAQLSPVDFALGWGPMSDSSVLAGLDVTQSGRFFWVRWENEPPIPRDLMFESAANTHLIPANDTVSRALDRMRAGHVVNLKGLLVNLSAADGWRWNSSLVRDDRGAGACELFWVTEAWIEKDKST